MSPKPDLLRAQDITLRHAANEAAKVFTLRGIETATLDARLLAAHACDITSEAFIMERDRTMTECERRTLDAFRMRRLDGEPVSRIIGRREFWGLQFTISPEVLDPRPETELVVETILVHLDRRRDDRGLRILDLGVGSGCILAALLTEFPAGFGFGIDISFEAAQVAGRNFEALGLIDRTAILVGNWLEAIAPGSFDVIVSNPPYIPSSDISGLTDEVRLFDPRTALDGGVDGLNAYSTIAPYLNLALRPGGIAVFETGYDQADEVAGLLAESGFDPSVLLDLAGQKRAVAVRRQS